MMADAVGISIGEWTPYIVMVAVEFMFALVNIMLKEMVDDGMNHLVIIAYRLGVSTVFLAPIAYFLESDRRPKLSLRIACLLFFSAMIGASLTQYCLLLGIQYTSATFATAFINMVPVVTFIMALPFRMERVDLHEASGKAKVLGSLISIIGVMVLTFYRGIILFGSSDRPGSHPSMAYHPINMSSTKRTEQWVLSSMALAMGSVLWSSWFLLQSFIGQRYPCNYSSTAIMSFFGTIQSAALAVVLSGGNRSMWMFKGTFDIIAILFTGIVGSGVCYVGMSWCVKKRGPVFTVTFSPLVQIFVAMIDIPLLHELLHLGSVIGSILVMIGLYSLLWGKNKEAKDNIKSIAPAIQEVKEAEPKLQVITISSDHRCP